MAILLLLVLALVLWSVRLLHGAYRLRDFSLLLASGLVAISAGGVIFVYSLMNGCVGYLSQEQPIPESDAPVILSDVAYFESASGATTPTFSP
ncbi:MULTISPECIES: hypothetical protein [unclassified Thermosynechococcus]|uniref:hypothetical protein n=1 Tax=unclassified Thermosynechococcus TaxID=2622553 RepID=UPI0028772DEF|nr:MULTISPECIES: hypothetical protein [unclassified Thermosynechococcus]WNC52453.1 hypothetical protein RHJ02_11485 [Thermosynechococcus sp. TG215]WNC57539.1 hypothetical protein RHJ13_11515 [Thermosynechococcus sp. TG218]